VVRTVALVGSLLGLLVTLPLYAGFEAAQAGLQFVEKAAWIERLNANYHLGVDGLSVVVRDPDRLHHGDRGDRRLGGDREPRRAVLRRLPHPVGPDDRRVRRRRRAAVLHLLRGHADPDVHHHRRLGRAKPGLRGVQVLPLHAGGARC